MIRAETIKSRFYAVDYTVRRKDGTHFNLHSVEYAISEEVLDALVHKERKHIESENIWYSVTNYTISQADDEDIMDYLVEDSATAYSIISDMLDVSFSRADYHEDYR